MNADRSRIVAFCVLLVPAVLLGAFSLWFFVTNWIALAAVLVGFAIAAMGARFRLSARGVAVVAVVQVIAILTTMVVAFLIDCSLHCE